MNDVTRMLSAIERGEARAAEEFLPLVYDELQAAGGGEARPRRSRVRRSRQPPWSTRRTCGWSDPSPTGPGTGGGTSSPPPPRRCGASWSTERAGSGASNEVAADYRITLDLARTGFTRARARPAGAGRGIDPPRRPRPSQGRAGQAPLLRRADSSAGR